MDQHALFDRTAVYVELERVVTDYHHLLASMSADTWRLPTNGTRWTNGEMMFHLMFGYIITWTLLRIVKGISHLPSPVQKGFAWLLNAGTPMFHPLNYFASWLGAKVAGRKLMGRRLSWLCARLRRNVGRETEAGLARGMNFPTRWDPFFKEFMTLGEVYRYPTQHYDYHRDQLNLHQQS